MKRHEIEKPRMPIAQFVSMSQRARRSSAAWALFGSMGVALSGPALGQSAASSIDQPTPGTLQHGTSIGGGSGAARDHATGQMSPPSAIQSSTDVMQSESPIQGKSRDEAIDPIRHLSKDMR